MSIRAQSNFDTVDNVTGSLPPGWANCGGSTWAVGTTNPISGARSFGSTSKGSLDVATFSNTAAGAPAAVADMGVQFDQLFASQNNTGGCSIAPIARSNAAGDTFYTALITGFLSSTTCSLSFYKRLAGSYSEIVPLTVTYGFTLSVGDVLDGFFTVVGTTLNAYFAKNGGAFPGTPQATTTDSSITAAGYPGLLYSLGSASAPAMAIDNFVVNTGTFSASMVAGVATSGAVTSTTAAATATAPTNGSGSIAYQWYRSTTANALGSAVSGQTTTSLADTGLTAGTTYYYALKQTDANGNFVYTNQIAETPSPKYTRVDATDSRTGQNVMVLVPNSNAALPYNSAVPTGVIYYVHGAGEDQTALVADSLKAASVIALLDAGYILAGTNGHGDNWGNQVSVDDYAGLDEYVRANYNVANVCLWGQSMGGLDSLLVLAQNKVQGIVGYLGTYPAVSLSNIYGLGTFTTAINTAYGITGSGLYTYAHQTRGNDPLINNAIAFRGVPMRLYSSPSDTTVPKTNNSDALLTLVRGSSREVTIIACTGVHGDPSHFQPSDYVAFFQRCFALPVPKAGVVGRPAQRRVSL